MSKDSASDERRRQERDQRFRGIPIPPPKVYPARPPAEIRRIALEALRACPPDPEDWGDFGRYLRGLDLGPDLDRVNRWARESVRFGPQFHPNLGVFAARPDRAAAAKGQGTAGYACRYCGAPATAVDHVWPRSRGGDDHQNNLVPVCTPCNGRKGSSSWLTDRCAGCGFDRDPGDVVTATGEAFYACRCGASWQRVWDLQHIAPPGKTPVAA